MLTDRFGRRITYLRVSLTDRCNLRCTYCMPKNYHWMGKEKLLTLEEVVRVIGVACKTGIEKIRITGGEPLLRHGAVDLIKRISRLPMKIYMTTNGLLLEHYAGALYEAGLQGLNVSLDSLNEEKFSSITGGGKFSTVLAGIRKAKEAGFRAIKVNVVVMRGLNSDEIEDFLLFSKQEGVTIRFIEYMPFSENITQNNFFSRSEILKVVEPYLRHDRAASSAPGDVAVYYPLRDGGEFGIISPVTCKFCSLCNRLRLTADGYLKPCLGAKIEVNIKEALRNGAADKNVQALFQEAILMKPAEGSYEQENMSERLSKRPMVCIGG